MKISIKYLLPVLLLLGGAGVTMAQFTVDAQLRPRAEYRQGYRIPNAPGLSSAFFVSQRSRLIFGYRNDLLELQFSPQDVHVWGQQIQMTDLPSVGLSEAWAKLKITDGVYIKAGRQEIIYDHDRLLGNVDWAQQARSHDALMLMYKKDLWSIDAGGAFNQSQENIYTTDYRADNYKALSFARIERKLTKADVSVIGIYDVFEKNDTVHDMLGRITYGANFNYKPDKLKVAVSTYLQQGKSQTDTDIFAYMVNAFISYKMDPVTIGLGGDYVSGDDPMDAAYQAFNTLYATNHKFYGYMDYYLNIPKDTRGGGLQDYYLNATVKLSAKASLALNLHQFMLANDVYDLNGAALDKNLGNEADAVFTFKPLDYLKVHVGGSAYLPTYATQQIKGGSEDVLSGWGWVMLDVTPRLYEHNLKNSTTP